MWPWGHLAVGYLGFLAGRRAPPGGPAALLLALGTQFPDLVDKPLAWTFGVLPGGTTLAHSMLVAIPLVLLALALAHRFDRTALGEAFGIGYGSHLLGDLLYPLLTEGGFHLGYLLWPLVAQPRDDRAGLLANFQAYFGEFVAFLGTTEGTWYLLLELAFLSTAVLVWLLDGRPGLHSLVAAGSASDRSE